MDMKESLFKTSIGLSTYEGFRPAALNAFKQFTGMIAQWINKKNELTPSKLLLQIIENTGYGDFVRSQDDSQLKERWENVAELCKALEEFEADWAAQEESTEGHQSVLSGFLEWVSLISDIDESPDKTEMVMLMTLHSAKGLEFPVVFFAGFEEGILPHQLTSDDPVGKEEERRLAYVGITRAKEKIFISYAYSRMIFGKTEMRGPSPFLKEIPPQLIETIVQAPVRTKPAKGKMISKSLQRKTLFQKSLEEEPAPEVASPAFGVGDRVRHRKYGIGQVMMVDGDGDKMNVQVDFENFGVKILRQKMANLVKV